MDGLKKLLLVTTILRDEKVLPSPEQNDIIRYVIEAAFKTLSPREEKIIKMRFGLGPDTREYSLREISDHFLLSRESIYRIESKALKKLGHLSISRRLRSVLDEVLKEKQETETIPAELMPVVERVKRLTPALIAYLRTYENDINKLRWEVFEHLIAEFFVSSGFEDVRLVGRNPKTSADIFAVHSDPLGSKIRYFIEVKRWKHKVGVQIIDQVYGAMLSERPAFGWHAAMVVSLVGFTDFEKYNRESLVLKGVELKDRSDLLGWLRGYKPNGNGLWLPDPRNDL